MLAATISEHPHFIVNENGDKESVILSMNDYSNLLEELEDLATVAERQTEKSYSHSEVLAELKSDGYL